MGRFSAIAERDLGLQEVPDEEQTIQKPGRFSAIRERDLATTPTKGGRFSAIRERDLGGTPTPPPPPPPRILNQLPATGRDQTNPQASIADNPSQAPPVTRPAGGMPSLDESLTDSEKRAIANGTLAKSETGSVGAVKPSGTLGPLEGAGAALARGTALGIQGVGAVAQGAQRVLGMVTGYHTPGTAIPGMPLGVPLPAEEPTILTQAGKAVEATGKRMAESFPKSPEAEGFHPGNWRWWSENLMEQAPQMAVQMAVAGPASALGKIGQVLSFAAPAVILDGGMAYSEAKADLIKRGVPESEADDRAALEGLAVGAGSAVLESISGSEILLKASGLGKTFRQMVLSKLKSLPRAITAESATEVAQEALGDIVKKIDRDDPELMKGWKARYGGIALISGAMGGLAHAGVHGEPDVSQETLTAPPPAAETQTPAPALTEPGRNVLGGEPVPLEVPAEGQVSGTPAAIPPVGEPTAEGGDVNAEGLRTTLEGTGEGGTPVTEAGQDQGGAALQRPPEAGTEAGNEVREVALEPIRPGPNGEKPVVGISRARLENILQWRGLQIPDSPEKQSWVQAMEIAEQKGMTKNPVALARNALESGRVIEAPELMAYLNHEFGLVQRQKAIADRLEQPNVPEDERSVLQAEESQNDADLQAIADASIQSGTTTARALAARGAVMDADMEIHRMAAKAKRKKGADLTTAEYAELQKLADTYKAERDAAHAQIEELTGAEAEEVVQPGERGFEETGTDEERNATRDEINRLLAAGCAIG